jgi:hypothetical protein
MAKKFEVMQTKTTLLLTNGIKRYNARAYPVQQRPLLRIELVGISCQGQGMMLYLLDHLSPGFPAQIFCSYYQNKWSYAPGWQISLPALGAVNQ